MIVVKLTRHRVNTVKINPHPLELSGLKSFDCLACTTYMNHIMSLYIAEAAEEVIIIRHDDVFDRVQML